MAGGGGLAVGGLIKEAFLRAAGPVFALKACEKNEWIASKEESVL